MKILEHKVALVTGGTSGIGKATAIAMGAAGAKVVFSGRRENEGEDVANSIRQFGGECLLSEEIAATVVFLCFDAANYITGQSLLVDGGYTAA